MRVGIFGLEVRDASESSVPKVLVRVFGDISGGNSLGPNASLPEDFEVE